MFLHNLWELFVDMSFYISIGLLFTGILHAFVKKDVILKHIGKQNTSSVVKASVLGVPLPLCSCGVVPTAIYLGKSGGSKGAVVSFLTSTPQTGVDSIVATYGLMGPLFAVYRALAAFASGIVSGIATNIFCKNDEKIHTDLPESCSCACEGESCASATKTQEEDPSFTAKLKSVFSYGFGEFLDEIALHFVIGLIIAALISTVIPEQWLASFTNPIISMVIMLIIGIPMYICSTASIPIALSLIMKGLSPGAAFVFLFAGPITNIASLTILYKALGKKVVAIYLACAAVCSILFGLLLDYIIQISNYSGLNEIIASASEDGHPVYMTVVAVGFAILLAISLTKRFCKKFRKIPPQSSCCSHSQGE